MPRGCGAAAEATATTGAKRCDFVRCRVGYRGWVGRSWWVRARWRPQVLHFCWRRVARPNRQARARMRAPVRRRLAAPAATAVARPAAQAEPRAVKSALRLRAEAPVARRRAVPRAR